MKSAHEIAENLVNQFSGMTFSGGLGGVWLISEIAKTLEDYARVYAEKRVKKIKESRDYYQGKAYKEAVSRNIRSEALEQAAKIAEGGPPPGSVVEYDGDVSDSNVVVPGFQRWIADKIRELKTK